MINLSIIIITYNSNECIRLCLDSIFNRDFNNFEVIIIDNNSTDATKLMLQNYPQITLIENPENYGFSKAVNQGINIAKGRYILCLNHDVELKEKFLVNIQKAIEANINIGVIQPKILRQNNTTIDTTGIHLSLLRRFYDIGNGQKDGDKFNKPRYVFGASAAAALYRREALESIKQDNEYFDEDFFCIAEDVDLSWRMQKKSWRILYTPNAVCVHKGGISRHQDKYTQYLSMRNRYLMIIKNENLWGFLRLPIVFIIYDFWRNLFMLITNYKYSLKTHCELIRLLDKMTKKRYALQK